MQFHSCTYHFSQIRLWYGGFRILSYVAWFRDDKARVLIYQKDLWIFSSVFNSPQTCGPQRVSDFNLKTAFDIAFVLLFIFNMNVYPLFHAHENLETPTASELA